MIIRLQLPPPPQTLIIHSSSPSPKPPLKISNEANPNPNSKNSQFLQDFTYLKREISSSPLPTEIGSDSGLLFRKKLLHIEKLKIDVNKALNLNPDFRSWPLENLITVEKCLYSMGIERYDMGRIFDMYPQLLTADIYTDIYPVFDFLLNDVNIPFSLLRKALVRCPRLLVCSIRDRLRPTLYFLRNLGFVGEYAITCQTTLLLVSNVEETLIPKLDYLQGLGFSYKETIKMVLRSPALLTCSVSNNFRPKVEYFLNEMKGDLVEVKRFPQYFQFSLEKKIKPRHQLLVEHGFTLPLSDMLKISDGEFNAQLIEMRLQTLESLTGCPGRSCPLTATCRTCAMWFGCQPGYMKAGIQYGMHQNKDLVGVCPCLVCYEVTTAPPAYASCLHLLSEVPKRE